MDKPRYRYNWETEEWDQLFTIKFNPIFDYLPTPPLRYESFGRCVATSDDSDDYSNDYLVAKCVAAFISGCLFMYICLT